MGTMTLLLDPNGDPLDVFIVNLRCSAIHAAATTLAHAQTRDIQFHMDKKRKKETAESKQRWNGTRRHKNAYFFMVSIVHASGTFSVFLFPACTTLKHSHILVDPSAHNCSTTPFLLTVQQNVEGSIHHGFEHLVLIVVQTTSSQSQDLHPCRL